MQVIYDLNMKALKEADIELFNKLDKTPDLDVEVINSKSGQPVPKANGVLLHSSYDPVKEAEVFSKSYRQLLDTQDINLVMGYAFGYHVEKLSEMIKDDEQKYLFVVEPDIMMFKKSLYYRDVTKLLQKVTFIVGYAIDDLFKIPGFYQILNVIHYTIGYKPSVAMNESYYVDFVKRRSSNKVEHLQLEADQDAGLQEILSQYSPSDELDLNTVVSGILSSNEPLTYSEKVFLLMGEFKG